MRLDDDDLSNLILFKDFDEYYETLSADEIMQEVDRLYDEGSIVRGLYQRLAMCKRLSDIATTDRTLTDHKRSAVIGVCVSVRNAVEEIIIPLVSADLRQRVARALAASDDYINRFAYYPEAAKALLVRNLHPIGPYEVGAVGQILEREPEAPSD